MMTRCDYHNLLVVCDTCGHSGWRPEMPDKEWFHAGRGLDYIGQRDHAFKPVHVTIDPDGLQPSYVVPCGLA